jgi:hypothetical protein
LGRKTVYLTELAREKEKANDAKGAKALYAQVRYDLILFVERFVKVTQPNLKVDNCLRGIFFCIYESSIISGI